MTSNGLIICFFVYLAREIVESCKAGLEAVWPTVVFVRGWLTLKSFFEELSSLE